MRALFSAFRRISLVRCVFYQRKHHRGYEVAQFGSSDSISVMHRELGYQSWGHGILPGVLELLFNLRLRTVSGSGRFIESWDSSYGSWHSWEHKGMRLALSTLSVNFVYSVNFVSFSTNSWSGLMSEVSSGCRRHVDSLAVSPFVEGLGAPSLAAITPPACSRVPGVAPCLVGWGGGFLTVGNFVRDPAGRLRRWYCTFTVKKGQVAITVREVDITLMEARSSTFLLCPLHPPQPRPLQIPCESAAQVVLIAC